MSVVAVAEAKGNNAYQYKGGKPKCIDCGELTTQYNTKRCRSCYLKTMIGETSPHYKGGKKNGKCLFCEKEFSSYYKEYCSGKCAREAKKGVALGAKAYNWIADRTAVLEKHRLRGTQNWKDWRAAVFARDSFTCKECGVTGVYIEPHHIIPLRVAMERLFDTNNGITLCRPCHKKTMWREEEFADKYTAILTKV